MEISTDKANNLMARAQFTPRDMPHPLGVGFGHSIGRMFREGFMSGVSVGFGVKKYTINADDDLEFLETELYEWSPTPIPKDPNALFEAERRGIDTKPLYVWCERALDTGEMLIVPVEQVRQAHAALKEIHGTTASGTKVEFDSKEAVSLFGKLKRLVTPRAEPAAEEDNQMNEEHFKELTEHLRALTEKVDALAETRAAPAPAPAPEPPTPAPAPAMTQAEEDAENLGDPEVMTAVTDFMSEEIDRRLRAKTGVVD